MEIKELTCIGCPLGCNLRVAMEKGEVKSITGYACERGRQYAGKEVTNPTRTVTSTVKVKNGDLSVVSVKTCSDIPKDKIGECISALRGVTVTAPVSIGDVILENAANTNINVIATKNVKSLV